MDTTRLSRFSDYELKHAIRHLLRSSRYAQLERVILSPTFLEQIAERDYKLELTKSLAEITDVLPIAHPVRTRCAVLREAIHRDFAFVNRSATRLFQCLWNNCWWDGSLRAQTHFLFNDDGSSQRALALRPLSSCLERWRKHRKSCHATPWVRSLRPPGLRSALPIFLFSQLWKMRIMKAFQSLLMAP